MVCVTGYLPGGPGAAHANESQRNGTVCWDGCSGGFTEGVQVAWSAVHAGFFAAELTVPTTAWLTADGPQPLAPGTYPVGVQCIAPTAGGCALQPAQATARFRLRGPAPQRCAAGQPCASLSFSPDAGVPGTTVHVSGWAPLTNVIGSQPFGYTLVLDQGSPPPMIGQVSQSLDGSLSGTVRLPASLSGGGPLAPGTYRVALEAFFSGAVGAGQPVAKGATVVGGRMLLAPTPLTISPPATWASLGQLTPLAIQPSTDLFGGGITAVGRQLAYCTPDGIRMSTDGGQTWSTVSTAGVADAVAKAGYTLPAGAAGCHAALPDPAHAGSVYATFGLVTPPCNCAPPYFMVGLATHDGGRSWQVIPQPAGFTAPTTHRTEAGDLGFGGFQVQGQQVTALFGFRGAGALTVEGTTDGGRTWTAGQLACPATGPCVRWGPAPSQVSACMTEFPQPLEVQAGGDWSAKVSADLCRGQSQLAGLSSTDVALLSPGGSYPLQISRDGGRTWTYVALPEPAAGSGQPEFRALLMLPDGSLLAQSPVTGGASWLLPPAAKAWCSAGGLSSAAQATSLTAADGRLWWLAGRDPNGAQTLLSVPLTALACR